MHDSNYRDEFEEYLQEQVGEHRMYPSDRVWKNIRGKVNTQKKWPALSVFTVLIISALVIGTLMNKPVPDSIMPNFVYASQASTNNNQQTTKQSHQIKSNDLVAYNYSIDQLTSKTIVAAIRNIM